tara:strand:- start:2051 stop:2536 length:486 start_codon:yes stop_codon:yes gene_type:complete
MAYTKRDIVDQAFEEIGLAGYVFDLQPQQLNSALRKLDMMMATWNSRGIRLGYPLPSSPNDSDLNEEVGVPDNAFEAMYLNLSVRISGGFGKTVSPETRSAAKLSYKELMANSALPIEMQLGNETIPSGAGNKGWRYYNDPFLRAPQNPLTVGSDGILDLE